MPSKPLSPKRVPPKKAKPPTRSRGVTLDDVRKVALDLPDTAERPSYGTPGFRVRDKLFARMFDDETLVLKVDPAFRDAMLEASPEVFYLTPHYEAYPWVLVRLCAIDRADLRELLVEARELTAPPARATTKSRARS